MSDEEEQPRKKKVKKIKIENEDSFEEAKTTKRKKKKKSKKKKKVKTELNMEASEQNEEEDELPKPKKKKGKKKNNKLNISSEKEDIYNRTDYKYKNEEENEENQSENEEMEKEKKKKKKKKKKKIPKVVNTEEDIIENEINNKNDDISDNKNENEDKEYQEENNNNINKIKRKDKEDDSKNNINIINNNDSFNEFDDDNIKKNNYDEEEKNSDYNNSGLISKQEDEEDYYNENNKKKKKEGKIKKSYKHLDPSNIKINTKNKKDLDITKSKILNLFSTKTLRKQNSDYEDSKDNKDINIDSPFKDIKEEEKNNFDEDEQSEGSFINLLSKINNLDYQGYNYTIKVNNDYFKRTPNEPPMKTILNSEDAAIKTCEELMESLENELKWEDPEFGPQKNDNGQGSKNAIYGEYGTAESLGVNVDNISWYGIKEINEDATFFYDGTESNDVMQGALGDCWFISALSVIATKDYLLRGEFNKSILEDGKIDEEEIKMMSEGIYPPIFHSFATKGIYCFRFYKNFKWRYILVDDRIPCYSVYNENQTKKPIFAHCRLSNEFWVPLIEKAYAKLHGSYTALVSGCIDDGLVDMTGLVSKKMVKENLVGKSEQLWELLKERSKLKFEGTIKTQTGKIVTAKIYTRNKSMMGCSVEHNGKNKEMEVSIQGHKVGIIAGHAYSILDVFEIDKPRSKKPRKSSRLLRIRNPWGNYEWNGKWCDNSEEVLKNKEKIEKVLNEKYKDTNEKIDFSKNDGAFLMRFSDFRKIFNNIFFCQNFPPSYIGIRFYDKWDAKNSGGLPLHNTNEELHDFFLNPQYFFEIKKPGKVIICLLQNDGRLYGDKFPFQKYVKKVCLIVFKARSERPIDNFNDHIDQTVIAQRREICLELNLQAGKYIAIPSLKDKGDYTSFKLEFYFEDELLYNTKNNKFDFKQLKNTNIKKFGDNPQCELINEYIASEVKMASQNKLDFIISEFQYSLKKEEENKKNEGKIISQNLNNSYEDEDF